MSGSPVEIDFKQFVQIQRNAEAAVYLQIAQQLLRAIQSGSIPLGSRLPGTRKLATELQIHRKTAIAVYDELSQLGWLEQIPNKGTFVLQPQGQLGLATKLKTPIATAFAAQGVGFEYTPSVVLESPLMPVHHTGIVVNDGWADERLPEIKVFYLRYHSVMKRKLGKWTAENTRFSERHFLMQLRNYLEITRSLRLSENELAFTRTIERALFAVIHFLIRPNDVVVVGNLSYHKANMHFVQAGAIMRAIAVDEAGLDIQALEELLQTQKVRCVYVNPNVHFPTTAALSAQRRLHLLELAKKYRFAILEDESESELQYEANAQLPLYREDTNGQVIYVGGMGKALLSHLQTGYIAAHPLVVEEIQKYIRFLDPQGDRVLQHSLAELIQEGEVYRFYKKAVILYRFRRDLVLKWVQDEASEYWKASAPTHGLAVWIEFLPVISMEQWRRACADQQLLIPRELLYQTKTTRAIRLGFGTLNAQEIQTVLQKMLTQTKRLSS